MAVVKFGKNKSGKKFALSSIIALAVAVCFMFITSFLERRISVFISLAILILGVVCILLYRYIKKTNADCSEEKYCAAEEKAERKKKSKLLNILLSGGIGLCFAGVLALSRTSRYYTFISGGLIPFWEIALPLGAVAGAIAFLLLRGKEYKTSVKVINVVAAVLLVAVVSCWTMSNLNYALDFSDPKEYHAYIEDKKHTDYRKSSDSYEFILIINGEKIKIDVPLSVYKSYNIGELFPVNEYKGFFGKTFFIFE